MDMPAIQPARLKKQAFALASNFTQPDLFVRELHSLLNYYSDHTHRPGQAIVASPLQDSYNVPPPVMRQLWRELVPMIKLHPEAVLPLCDGLWAENNYDLQLLAARLLGQVPVDTPAPIIDRLQNWTGQVVEKRLLDKLLEYGLSQLQQTSPEYLFSLLTSWLTSSELSSQHVGLRAMLPIIDLSGTEKLPSISRLLTPFLRLAPSYLRPDIIAVLTALAHCSPSETAFLLRQNLNVPNNPDTAWLIRQVLDAFPSEIQSGLRMAMKGKG